MADTLTHLTDHEIEVDDRILTLHSDHFVVNIALPEHDDTGMARVNRDPRRFRIKPAAYIGTVEKVAKTCTLVKIGDRVAFERWVYDQEDLDAERLIARERQLLIINEATPAPRVIVLKLLEAPKPKTALALPETLEPMPERVHRGMVLASADARYKQGEILWVERYDEGQFRYGDNLLAFRHTGRAAILMKGWTKEYQEFQREQMKLSKAEFAVVLDELGFQSV